MVLSQIALTVSSLADSGTGSLRAAILVADAGRASDKFTIDIAVTGMINLESPLPDLSNSIAIQGPGADSLAVQPDVSSVFRFSPIFTVAVGRTASLSGLTIANGHDGGIENDGTLTVSNSTVSNNSAGEGSFGGGIVNNGGMLTIRDSSVTGNSATFGGGGIDNENAGTLTISGSTLSGNSAPHGGGIDNENAGTLTISDSSLTGNSATLDGGGILNDQSGTLTISTSTFSGNSASNGGAILNNGA